MHTMEKSREKLSLQLLLLKLDSHSEPHAHYEMSFEVTHSLIIQ